MQIKTRILLVAISLCFVTLSVAQRGNINIKNGMAIGGGLTLFDINTDSFSTEQGSGWLATASATADLPHKWYNVSYNIKISENKLGISGRVSDDVEGNETINYTLFAAQLSFLMHVKLVGAAVTLDAGPQLQYNGKLAVENNQEDYFINGYEMLQAKDLEDISKFNFNGTIGLTAGFGQVKVRAHYIYGFTNMLNKLNSNNLNIGNTPDFKGHMSMFAFSAMFTF